MNRDKVLSDVVEDSVQSFKGFYLVNSPPHSLNDEYKIFDRSNIIADAFSFEQIQKDIEKMCKEWRVLDDSEACYQRLVSFFAEHIQRAKELGAMPVLLGEVHMLSLPFYTALIKV